MKNLLRILTILTKRNCEQIAYCPHGLLESKWMSGKQVMLRDADW